MFGGSQTLALCVGNHVIEYESLTHNGTAVVVVCVTSAAIRFPVPVVWQGTVPVASRYGAIFAIMVCAGFCAIAIRVDGY